MPASLKCEPGVIRAESDYVIVHGRFSGTGRPRNWIAADVVRVADGMLAEHWDILQDDATKAESRSGLPEITELWPNFQTFRRAHLSSNQERKSQMNANAAHQVPKSTSSETGRVAAPVRKTSPTGNSALSVQLQTRDDGGAL
jgi:hypothetical protein